MKAIEHTKQIFKKIIHLIYATCTNDIIVYSKQASNIELFIVAFFVECNRLFIADSIAMNAVQKHYFNKIQAYTTFRNTIAEHRWFQIKKASTTLWFSNKTLSGIYPKQNRMHTNTKMASASSFLLLLGFYRQE
ncbi:hypothetical protein [Flavobacterium crassostreae]|nr:hypothetical protein [Flavobacterium crassostreae]